MHKAPFCTKNNSRENRFFAATHPLDDKKGTHNVKKSTKNVTSTPIHNRPLSTQFAQKQTFRRFGKACTPTMCGDNALRICLTEQHSYKAQLDYFQVKHQAAKGRVHPFRAY